MSRFFSIAILGILFSCATNVQNNTEETIKNKSKAKIVVKKSKKFFIMKNGSQREITIKISLSYLKDTNEDISQVKIDGNNVILKWSSIPSYFNLSNRAIAFNANRALGSGVHVWSVPNSHRGWNPITNYICTTTARYGKVKRSTCR